MVVSTPSECTTASSTSGELSTTPLPTRTVTASPAGTAPPGATSGALISPLVVLSTPSRPTAASSTSGEITPTPAGGPVSPAGTAPPGAPWARGSQLRATLSAPL